MPPVVPQPLGAPQPPAVPEPGQLAIAADPAAGSPLSLSITPGHEKSSAIVLRTTSTDKAQILEIRRAASRDPAAAAARVRDALLVDIGKATLGPSGKLKDLPAGFIQDLRAKARARKSDVIAAEARE